MGEAHVRRIYDRGVDRVVHLVHHLADRVEERASFLSEVDAGAREQVELHCLCGGEFWTDGYFVSTVDKHGSESVTKQYIQNQGAESHYERLYEEQLNLF